MSKEVGIPSAIKRLAPKSGPRESISLKFFLSQRIALLEALTIEGKGERIPVELNHFIAGRSDKKLRLAFELSFWPEFEFFGRFKDLILL